MPDSVYIRRARKSSKHNHSMQTEMPFNCLACGEAVTARQEGIECDGCHCWQHRTCIPNLCRAEYRQACRVGYMDWTCQQCIAIASASVVATAAFSATVDLADRAIPTSAVSSSTVAPASVAVAAADDDDATVADVAAVDTAPVADDYFDVYAGDLGIHAIPSAFRENEVADPRRPPREIESPDDGIVTYVIVEEASIRGKVRLNWLIRNVYESACI